MRRVRQILSPFSFALVALAALLACDNGADCTLNNVVMSRYTFYANGAQCVVTDTLSVLAVGSDSVLVNRDYDLRSLTLPMSYYRDEDTLVLRFKHNVTVWDDTIYISKTNTPSVESINCPTAMFHTITAASCTHHSLDSIVIITPEVNYAQPENLRIYLSASGN